MAAHISNPLHGHQLARRCFILSFKQLDSLVSRQANAAATITGLPYSLFIQ